MEKDNKKIGYLGGCWDLFHIGHLNCIRAAKSLCDYLIVEVTPDEIMFSQKQKYPIIKENDRLEIIRAIKYVDHAELSDSSRDLGALKKYQYNVLFISDDHRGKPYYVELEKDLSARGIEIVYLPYTNGISSTIIRSRLNEQDNSRTLPLWYIDMWYNY